MNLGRDGLCITLTWSEAFRQLVLTSSLAFGPALPPAQASSWRGVLAFWECAPARSSWRSPRRQRSACPAGVVQRDEWRDGSRDGRLPCARTRRSHCRSYLRRSRHARLALCVVLTRTALKCRSRAVRTCLGTRADLLHAEAQARLPRGIIAHWASVRWSPRAASRQYAPDAYQPRASVPCAS